MVRFLFPSRIKYFVVHSGQKKLNKVQYTQCEHHPLGYRYPITLQHGVHQLGWHQDRRPEKYEWRRGQTMNGFRALRHVVDSNRSMLRISMVLQPWTFTEYISQEVLHKIQANRPYEKKTHGVGIGTLCGIIWNLTSKDVLAAPFHVRKFRCIFYHPLDFLRSYTAPSGMSIALQKMG